MVNIPVNQVEESPAAKPVVVAKLTELELRYGKTRPLDGALEFIDIQSNRILRALRLLHVLREENQALAAACDEIEWTLLVSKQ